MSLLGSVSQLLKRLKAGEQSALGKLLDRFWPFLIMRAGRSLKKASRRYADEEPFQQLHARGTTHANLLYDPSGSPLTPDRVRAALAASPTVSTAGVTFLVGSVRLQDAISAAPPA